MVMEGVDVVAMPTCPAVAEEIETEHEYYMAVLTSPWDHTGQPAISVSCGFGTGHMPVGISFAGRPFEEATICQVAHAYEQEADGGGSTQIFRGDGGPAPGMAQVACDHGGRGSKGVV